MTHQYFRGPLPLQIAKRVQQQVFSQSDLVSKYLPKDIVIVAKGESYPVNSLMLGMSSPLLHSSVRKECAEKGSKILDIPEFSLITAAAAVEYIHTGKVKNLWKTPQNLLLHILREAVEVEMQGFSDYCVSIYRRYLERETAGAILHLAQQHRWKGLKTACVEFINGQQLGASVEEEEDDGLGLYFHSYDKEAMELYGRLSDEITYLGYDSEVIDDPLFNKTIDGAPRLGGVSLQNSRSYCARIRKLPEDIEKLDISFCGWVDEERLKEIIELYPNLKALKLNGNIQLDYRAWSLLAQLKSLEILEVKGCNQLEDDDLLVIIRGCVRLRRLKVEGCSQLTERSLKKLKINNIVDIE